MRTYDNLRQRKQLVTEAMARILASETRKHKVLWINLFCCRISSGKNEDSESASSDEDDDKEIQLKAQSGFWQNDE